MRATRQQSSASGHLEQGWTEPVLGLTGPSLAATKAKTELALGLIAPVQGSLE
jgi:hypothetical protein